jgi:hypothetical protein
LIGAGGGGFGGGGGAGFDTSANGRGGDGGYGGGSGRGGGFAGFGGGIGTGGATPSGGGGAGQGGAIFNMQGDLTIRNSTLAINSAIAGTDNVAAHSKALGGAVFNLNGSFTAVGSTFAANIAANDGASIYNLVYDGATARTAETTLRDSIVSGGTGPVDLASDKPSAVIGASNLGDASAGVGEFALVRTMAARGGGAITGSPLTADPLLGSLEDNGGPTQTMAPAADSPVIDAGSAFGLTTDQRGQPRPFDFTDLANGGDGSDIGAFERQGSSPPAPPGEGGPGGGSPGGGSPDGPVAFGAKTLVTVRLGARRIPASGPLPIVVSNANGFAIRGKLSGATARRVAALRKPRRIALRAKAFRVQAAGKRTVRLKLPRALRRLLAAKGKLTLRMKARVLDPAGNARTVARTLSPKLRKKRRR